MIPCAFWPMIENSEAGADRDQMQDGQEGSSGL